MTSGLEPVMRPNGKPYRPRKVVAHRWDNNDDGPGHRHGVIVLGTHDIDRARALAQEALDWWHGEDASYATRPEVDWFRNGMQGGGRVWVRDEVHGAAGVLFTGSDDPEEG